jgi:hypothetical protein
MIPPRTEEEIEISCGPASALKGTNGIIGLFVYDVVTKQNEAGVVTEKQNFEWYFNYTMQPQTAQTAYSSGSGELTVAEYQQWQQEQAVKQQQQFIKAATSGRPGVTPQAVIQRPR